MADGFTEIAYVSRLQAAPDEQRGRLFGLSASAENTGFGLGMIVSAALLERFSPFQVVGLLPRARRSCCASVCSSCCGAAGGARRGGGDPRAPADTTGERRTRLPGEGQRPGARGHGEPERTLPPREAEVT